MSTIVVLRIYYSSQDTVHLYVRPTVGSFFPKTFCNISDRHCQKCVVEGPIMYLKLGCVDADRKLHIYFLFRG